MLWSSGCFDDEAIGIMHAALGRAGQLLQLDNGTCSPIENDTLGRFIVDVAMNGVHTPEKLAHSAVIRFHRTRGRYRVPSSGQSGEPVRPERNLSILIASLREVSHDCHASAVRDAEDL